MLSRAMRNEIHNLLRETMRHSGIPSEEVLLLFLVLLLSITYHVIIARQNCGIELLKHRYYFFLILYLIFPLPTICDSSWNIS